MNQGRGVQAGHIAGARIRGRDRQAAGKVEHQALQVTVERRRLRHIQPVSELCAAVSQAAFHRQNWLERNVAGASSSHTSCK